MLWVLKRTISMYSFEHPKLDNFTLRKVCLYGPMPDENLHWHATYASVEVAVWRASKSVTDSIYAGSEAIVLISVLFTPEPTPTATTAILPDFLKAGTSKAVLLGSVDCPFEITTTIFLALFRAPFECKKLFWRTKERAWSVWGEPELMTDSLTMAFMREVWLS